MIECIVTDLPDPVAPAISAWGIFARFPKVALPESPRPSATVSGLGELRNLSSPRSVASPTVDLTLFGISIPTSDLPGIGASIRIG
jgi:hypothetical protein